MSEENRSATVGEKSPNAKRKKKIAIAVIAAILVVAIVVVLVVVLTGGGISRSSADEVNIGASQANVTEILGEATHKDGNVWEYYDEEDAQKGGSFNYIRITFNEDKAEQIIFSATGKDLSGKQLQSITLLTKGSGESESDFYVTMPGDDTNAYDIAYATEYGDGSFCKQLVKSGVSSASAATVNFEWEDAFGSNCTARLRFTYPYSVTYIMNGGVNNPENIAGYSSEWLANGFTLLDPAENAYDFNNVKVTADGKISCTVVEKNFEGWYSDPEFTTRVTAINAEDGNVTLYAKWGGEKSSREYSGVQYVRAANTVLFGAYPQTIKADDVTISGSANEQGYYTGSDGSLYAAVTAAPHDGGYKFSNGEKVKEGDTYYFKVEPIQWRVLTDEDGALTLLAEDILDGMNFDDATSLWNESSVRQWLNDEFYNSAFDSAQAAMINRVTLDNGMTSVPVNSTGANTFTCENTSDNVWLLSYSEVQNAEYGFISELGQGDSVADGRDPERSKVVTDYARARGALIVVGNSDYAGNGSWWLRSAYYGSTSSSLKVMCVRSDGYVGVYDESTLTAGGIAPAIKVTLQ